MIRSSTFIIDKEQLRREFYSNKNIALCQWLFETYPKEVRDKIQARYYSDLEKCQLQIDFFP